MRLTQTSLLSQFMQGVSYTKESLGSVLYLSEGGLRLPSQLQRYLGSAPEGRAQIARLTGVAHHMHLSDRFAERGSE